MRLLVSYQRNLLAKTAIVNDHIESFHERIEVINNNFPLVQDDAKGKCKSVVIVGGSVQNNINSRGLSKSKRVAISSYSVATSEDILSAAEETLKTNRDTPIVNAGANDLTNATNTLKNVQKKKKRKTEKNITKDCFFQNYLSKGQMKIEQAGYQGKSQRNNS